jgi:hypothetical protein
MVTGLSGIRRKAVAIAAAVAVTAALLPAAPAYASSTNIVNAETTSTGWKIYTTKGTTYTRVTFAPMTQYGGPIPQGEDGPYLGLEAVPPGGPVADPEFFAQHWWSEYDRRGLVESGDGSAYIFVLAACCYAFFSDRYWGGNLTW